MDIFILKLRQKYTVEWYVCLFVLHTMQLFLEGFGFFFLVFTLLTARKKFPIEKNCWKVQFSVPCKLMILQLGSLFKKWLLYFINYLFTYAKSVSTTMLFLLMPIVALFLTYPAVNLWINLGLKIKASWLKGLK